MPTTPRLQLPYPALTDSANVPRDIQALAVKIDPGLPVDVVAAAPGTPYTGQLYYNTATSTLMVWDGTVWKPAVPAPTPSPDIPQLGRISGRPTAVDIPVTAALVLIPWMGVPLGPRGQLGAGDQYSISCLAAGSIVVRGVCQFNDTTTGTQSQVQLRVVRGGTPFATIGIYNDGMGSATAGGFVGQVAWECSTAVLAGDSIQMQAVGRAGHSIVASVAGACVVTAELY